MKTVIETETAGWELILVLGAIVVAVVLVWIGAIRGWAIRGWFK